MKFKKWEIQCILLCIASGLFTLFIGRYVTDMVIVSWIIGLFTGIVLAYVKVEDVDEKKIR